MDVIGSDKKMELRMLLESFQALSIAATRASIAGKLGKSFGGDRDVYDALGYTKVPQYDDYAALHRRGDIAKRIVEAAPRACWFGKGKTPKVTESETEDTVFEKSFLQLVDQRRIWHYLARADILSRIGRYAVLLLGFDDGEDLAKPVIRAGRLLYFMAYAENNAPISRWVADTKDERYGQPELYRLSISSQGGAGSGISREVHHSRILHLAEDRLESEVYGSPALEPILNRLKDLELIVGGGAEGIWRGAFPGIAFKADPEATLRGQDLDDFTDEIEDYLHKFKRYLRLKGIEPQQLMPIVADIRGHVDTELDLISATTGIPKRILLGSERGELASMQDERGWWNLVIERSLVYCEPMILRPFIDRLIGVDVLPKPAAGYSIIWPEKIETSPQDEAVTGKTRTEALTAYVNALGADMVIPPEVFLEDFLGIDRERIVQIQEILGAIVVDADGDGEEELIDD